MPDSEVARIVAIVPSCRGAKSLSTVTVISAWLSSVSLMAFTPPMRRPPTCTSSPFTSCPALAKRSLYSVSPLPRSSSTPTTTMATSSAASAAPRAAFTDAS